MLFDSQEEQKWLDALEKGELDDYGRVKQDKDVSMMTARQVGFLWTKTVWFFFRLSKLVIIFILKKSILNHTLLVWTLNNTVHCIKLDSTAYFWTSMCWRAIRPLASINPLRLNIKMYILHTVLFIYRKVLTRRICVTKKWNGDHCLYCSDLNVCFRGDIVRRN